MESSSMWLSRIYTTLGNGIAISIPILFSFYIA